MITVGQIDSYCTFGSGVSLKCIHCFSVRYVQASIMLVLQNYFLMWIQIYCDIIGAIMLLKYDSNKEVLLLNKAIFLISA